MRYITSMLDYLANSEVGAACDFELGESIARNTCRNDWHYDLDLRFSQELPFLGSLTGVVEDRVELFVDFENFLNMLDSSANIRRTRTQFLDIVDGGVDDQGRYIISGFRPDDNNNISISSSAWRIQIGARYEF